MVANLLNFLVLCLIGLSLSASEPSTVEKIDTLVSKIEKQKDKATQEDYESALEIIDKNPNLKRRNQYLERLIRSYKDMRITGSHQEIEALRASRNDILRSGSHGDISYILPNGITDSYSILTKFLELSPELLEQVVSSLDNRWWELYYGGNLDKERILIIYNNERIPWSLKIDFIESNGRGNSETNALVNNLQYPIEILKSEIATLRELIAERHGQYPLMPSDLFKLFDNEIERAKRIYGNTLTKKQMNEVLARILALTGDTHSKIDPYEFVEERKNLDFSISVTKEEGRRVFVAVDKDYNKFLDNDYPYIKSINGISIDSLIDQARPYIHQGASESFFYDRIPRYLGYWGHLYKLKTGKRFEENQVQIELENSKGESITVQTSLTQGEPPNQPRLPRSKTRIIKDQNIGVYRLKSFRTGPKDEEEFHQFMEKAKAFNGIIIDLRGNGGGRRTFFKHIFPYFMAEEQAYMIATAVACRKLPGCLGNGIGNRELFPINSDVYSQDERCFLTKSAIEETLPRVNFDTGLYEEIAYQLIRKNHPRAYTYKKPIVVLIDEGNYSSADAFLGGLATLPNVTIIGTPSSGGSGARKHGRNGLFRYRISETLSLDPLGRVIEGRGTKPDILIHPNIDFFIGKSDNVMEKALEHINNRVDHRP